MMKYSIYIKENFKSWLSPIAQGRGTSIQYTFMLFSVMFGIGSQDTQHRNLKPDTYRMLDLDKLGIRVILDVDLLKIKN